LHWEELTPERAEKSVFKRKSAVTQNLSRLTPQQVRA
jgi:hypothetical protein